MQLTDTQSISIREPETADEAPVQPAASSLHAKAKAAAEKFEAFFIAEMLRQMRRNAREFGNHDDAQHSRTNEDMLDLTHTMVADVLAGRHAFGVADLILRQVLPTLPADGVKEASFKSDASTVALKK